MTESDVIVKFGLFFELLYTTDDLTFVILKDLLDGSGGIVVNITDNVWIHNTGGGFEWIDSWVETQFGDGTGQDSGGIQL